MARKRRKFSELDWDLVVGEIRSACLMASAIEDMPPRRRARFNSDLQSGERAPVLIVTQLADASETLGHLQQWIAGLEASFLAKGALELGGGDHAA